ncbi:MAG: glycosyl hydrolase family 25 [Prevotella sp.]|nr:glycosyl hydrolase family 25 [Prevotella sp.]
MKKKRKRKKKSNHKYIYWLLALLLLAGGAAVAWKYLRKKPTPTNTHFDGIDVSHHQGTIQWATLVDNNPNLQFVYVRAIGKKGRDRNYEKNINRARRQDLMVGSYHFFVMNKSVGLQFSQFVDLVDKEKQDLRPVIDVEKLSLTNNRDKDAHLKDSVMKFAQKLEEHFGCKPVIYSNEHFYNQRLAPTFNRYPLWIAKYKKEQPRVKGDAKPILWQRSERGCLSGIRKRVDLDKFINDGSIEDLLMD